MLLIIKSFFKKYWLYVLIGLLVVISLAVLFLKPNASDKIKKVIKSFEDEIDVIDKNNKVRQEQNKKNAENYQKTLEKIQKDYAEDSKKIDRAKKKRIKELTKDMQKEVDEKTIDDIARNLGLEKYEK